MIRLARSAIAALLASASLTRLAVAAPADPPPAAATAPTPPPAAAPEPAAVPPPAPATSPAATPVPAAAAPTAPPSAIAPAPAASAATATTDSGATVNPPPPEREMPSSLELSLSLGPTVTFGEAANPEYNPSLTRVGLYGTFGVAYRSSYFIDPFIEVGIGSLASGEVTLPDGVWGKGGTLEQHLGVWTISPGITADIWRFRPRFGMGIGFIQQSYRFNGQEHSSTQPPLLAQLGLGFVAYDSDRLRLDIEGRTVIMNGAEVTFTTLDLIMRVDAVYFGARH